MIQIDKIFFGKDGLTSTSANYIANKAKEYIAELEIKFKNINFINEEVILPGTTEKKYTKKGCNFKELNDIIDNDVKTMYQVKSLIAWLREAIKTKDDYLNSISYKYTYNDYLEENNIEEERPQQETYLTEEDIIRSWDIETRKKYYDLETKCAVIGKLIHKDSPLSKGKEEMLTIINAPNRVEKFDNSLLIYERGISLKVEDLNDIIFKLQNEHRSYQAELNSLKHKIETELQKDKSKKNKIYKDKLNEYNNSQKLNYARYNEIISNLTNEISNYKIVIPNSLKETYELINNL